MVACRIAASVLLLLLPLVTTQRSFLQQKRRRSVGDWDDNEVKLCTFSAKTGYDKKIKVFADEAENTRYVSFVREGFATDDGFIESMQKCKGALPEACKRKNTSSSSSNCVDCPCELDSSHDPYGNYQRRMLELVKPQCSKSPQAGQESFRVLLVGLGGGALVQHILGQCPQGTVVEAVEYDSRMIEIATRFFGLHPKPAVFKVEQGDGGAVVAAHASAGKTYNMVLVDAFAGGSHVPESCRNSAFVTNLKKILRKGGTAVQNMAGPTYSNLAGPDDYKTTFPLYKEIFGSTSVDLEELRGNLEFPSRLIVAKVSS